MANTIVTLSSGDVVRKALSILHNELVFTKTINRQYDDRFARSGAKNGGTLLIREPNEFSIRTGQVMDTQDVTEITQTLTLATQLGVDINFSSVELTLSLDDFADRILQPAMARLATEVDQTILTACYPYVYNTFSCTSTAHPGLVEIRGARARLNQGLAPMGNRNLLADSLFANSIMSVGAAYVNPAPAISRQYERGLVGDLYGMRFWESETVPRHTNGLRTDATPTVNIQAATTSIENGVATVVMTTGTAASNVKAGDTFHVVGLYAINQETKARYSHLQQFSITAAVTLSTAAKDLSVSPIPYLSGVRQNMEVVTSSATAAVIMATGSAGSLVHGLCPGAPSLVGPENLCYHRDAFTAVFADLEMPKGVDFAAREVFDGISLRIVRQYDVVNDKFPCRIDVLFGQKCLRPAWACRIAGQRA